MLLYGAGDKILTNYGYIGEIRFIDISDNYTRYRVKCTNGYYTWCGDHNLVGKIIGNKLVKPSSFFKYDVSQLWKDLYASTVSDALYTMSNVMADATIYFDLERDDDRTHEV